MKLLKLYTPLLFLLFCACNQPEQTNEHIDIELGEDNDEINCYLTDIYEVQRKVYVDLDFVQITYVNIDEKLVLNENQKIRTYLIDNKTLIYTNDCQEVKPMELIKLKKSLTVQGSFVTVGSSKNGRMLSINFGCYG